MSKTVAIIYGFTEGEWHGTRFRKLLRDNGYDIVDNPKEADVVIAHSGGCYYVPLDLADNQLVILINPTYWPGMSLMRRSLRMKWQLIRAVRPGNHPWFQIWKTSHNLFYLVWHAGKNNAMVQRAPKYDLAAEIRHDNTILVRTANDPWLIPNLQPLQKTNPSLRIVELPGDHDDCWEHPERYLNLLESE